MKRFKVTRSRLVLYGIVYLGLVMARGCSIYMRANRPIYRNVSVLQPGATRNSVISELGVPEQSVEKDGTRVDTYKLDPNAQSEGAKVAVTSFHFVADSLTLGMWEVVGTPFELASQPDLTTYIVTYSAEDKVANVKTYEDSSPPAG